MKRVLVADMSPGMRSWVRAVVSPAQVTTVGSAWEALEYLADGAPTDVIVANRWLPGMAGHQLLATLRTVGIATPFALLAPLCRDKIRATVRRAGAAVVIDDPFDANALRRAIGQLCGGPPKPALGKHPMLTLMTVGRIVANS